MTDRRRLLGPDGIDTAAELFRSAGWSVRIADSPWRLDSSDGRLIEEWLDGWIGAAIEERPALEEWALEYAGTRAAELADGGLSLDVDHRDLLAWP